MGRRTKKPLKDGRIVPSSSVGSEAGKAKESQVATEILERLGLNDLVCTNCNARNPKRSDKCRKCNCKQFRKVNSDFADG